MVLIPNSGRPGPIYNDAAAQTSAAPSNTAYLLASNNLSDLTNVLQARLNLGLGTAATSSSAAFDPAGAATAAQNAAEAYARSLLSGIPSGTGSVTSVSVTTANGVSGVVATPTTTPAITLTLGAITPTTVNGITLTTGTGTLTLGTATLNAGTGGTLGPGAFASSSTGSGAAVLQTSPTLITPVFTGATLLGTTVLSSLTTNGFVKTTGGTGTLAVDTNTYQPLATNLTTLAALANPGVSGYVLSSTTGGVYSWVANGASSGFPITLGSTSIAAGSTTTSVNGLTIGATTPAAGTFTTLIGQLTEGIQGTNAPATVFYGQNTTSGTAAATKFGLANSSQQLVFYITDTAYTGAAIITGGIAKSATIFTDSPIPLVFGTNGTSNFIIASGGAATFSCLAGASAGVVQASSLGLVSQLAYTGSTTNFLRADGSWAAPSAGAVSSVSGSGSGISVSPTTGAVVVSNTGVTSIVAGTNVTISSGTGAVTVNASGGGFTPPASSNLISTASSTVVNAATEFYVASYASANAAFAAACAAGGVLVLPAGTTTANLSFSQVGAFGVGIRGCGMGASILNGTIQIVSGGTQPTASITLADFTCTGGIAFDLGTAGPYNAGGDSSGSITNVAITGQQTYNSASVSLFLRGAAQFSLSNVVCKGSSNTSGYGLIVDSCSNLQISNYTAYTYKYGLYGATTGGGAAGWECSNIRMANCQYGWYTVWAVNQGAFITNIMVDNGNASITGTVPIYMQGAGSGVNACTICGGEVLLASGSSAPYSLQLYNMTNVSISNVDFTFASPTDSHIFCGNTTSYTNVTGCQFNGGTLVHVDSGSTYNHAMANRLGVTFNNGGGATNQLLS